MTTNNLFERPDSLGKLNDNVPLAEKIAYLHHNIKHQFDFIDRISIALYDSKTDTLKTYNHSSGGENPLSHYEAQLADTGSLSEIVQRGQPRVVQDLSIFATGKNEHTARIAATGYRSSYTMPMYQNGEFIGFLFFNSLQTSRFTPECLRHIDVYGHLITSMVTNELAAIRTLVSTVQAARDFTNHRDMETGAHIDRTAHYARLIAKSLADRYGFDDDYIEHIFLFSPLHDIGKISVPDTILRKPDKLNDDEFAIMKTHTTKGRKIINDMIADFGLNCIRHIDIMGNIAEYHHEAVDGSGYPAGLRGGEIPIEARISAVADVFDALTTKRPYKEAWSNENAFALLRKLAGNKLDLDCVSALIDNEHKVLEIQARFRDGGNGKIPPPNQEHL